MNKPRAYKAVLAKTVSTNSHKSQIIDIESALLTFQVDMSAEEFGRYIQENDDTLLFLTTVQSNEQS